jgi:hypothetical protein
VWDEPSSAIGLDSSRDWTVAIRDHPIISGDVSLLGSSRVVGSTVDAHLLRSWLEVCEHDHGSRCSAPPWFDESHYSETMAMLRLIDVENRCITQVLPQGPRYVALSYVWGQGGAERLARRATQASIGELMEPGGLKHVALPRTIADALQLVSQLGERYLWADSLCILQDDAADVVRQTANMDVVYSHAVFTIIAAAGDNADAGLPGLLPGSRAGYQKRIKTRCRRPGALGRGTPASRRE